MSDPMSLGLVRHWKTSDHIEVGDASQAMHGAAAEEARCVLLIMDSVVATMIGMRPQTMAAKLHGELTVRQAVQDPVVGTVALVQLVNFLARLSSLGSNIVVELQGGRVAASRSSSVDARSRC